MSRPKKWLFLCSVILFASTPASVVLKAGQALERSPYAPTSLPDRIVLTWSDSPATTQAVTWRTDASVTRPVAQIAIAGNGPDFERRTRTVPATTTPLESPRWAAKHHSVVFTNLAPDTLYTYRVGDGTLWSEWFHFRTASNQPKPFSFLYFGDIQNDIRQQGSRVIREAFRRAPEASFLVFAGDLVDSGSDDTLWGEFFEAGSWILGMLPVVPAAGNHEYTDQTLPPSWRAQFALPLNGIAGLEETCYYLDYQGARIVVMNSVRMHDEQAPWLDRVLECPPGTWKVVIFHHPLFTLRSDRTDNSSLIKHWKPLFEKHHVDLVLTGHDHAYGRSGLIGGTVYVSSVAGAKQRPLNRQAWMACSGEGVQLYQVVRIAGNLLSYESLTAAGDLFDAFELRKTAGKQNVLRNLSVPVRSSAVTPTR